MILLSVIAAGAATWAAVECWNDSKFWHPTRCWFEARRDFWSDLTGCPYCLSHWVAVPATVLSMLAWAGPWDWFWAPIHWAACVRLATLGLAYVPNPFRYQPEDEVAQPTQIINKE